MVVTKNLEKADETRHPNEPSQEIAKGGMWIRFHTPPSAITMGSETGSEYLPWRGSPRKVSMPFSDRLLLT
jgi:hypothetical protein